MNSRNSKCAIFRQESAGKYAPSLVTLECYASGVDCELQVRLVPQRWQRRFHHEKSRALPGF